MIKTQMIGIAMSDFIHLPEHFHYMFGLSSHHLKSQFSTAQPLSGLQHVHYFLLRRYLKQRTKLIHYAIIRKILKYDVFVLAARLLPVVIFAIALNRNGVASLPAMPDRFASSRALEIAKLIS